ncbi:PDR/VanB family oxidoreductase [Variovorax sp. 770b2]|uniref:PDR/VanB family oxidoreductase n=1 Tax=Variovorax sp. 770b2 TaxID=1566271 RepID=UPI00210CAAAC|nr:PDR/VanB family oxidoreductase [Variovorax sp. 770b2]
MASTTAPPIDLRLRQTRLEAEGIVSYEFVSAGDAPLPAFSAGAHIDLHLAGDKVRSYSLANAPFEASADASLRRYLIAVQRDDEGKGGSAWMHATPRVGDVLRATPPVNDFALAEDAPHSIFIAGGIGITPVMSMLRQLDALGRPWRLHYASRSPAQTAFAEDVRTLDGETRFCFASSRSERLDIAAIVREAPPDVHLYCCGPPRMIDTFIDSCARRPPQTVHFERFAAAEAPATGGGYDVVLQRSGQRLTVVPGKTILDTLLDHGIDVPYACTAGVCGTCRTAVVDGQPDHRDDFLSDEEKHANTSVMICCSGARSGTLVLDL